MGSWCFQVWYTNPGLRDWLKEQSSVSEINQLKWICFSINKGPWLVFFCGHKWSTGSMNMIVILFIIQGSFLFHLASIFFFLNFIFVFLMSWCVFCFLHQCWCLLIAGNLCQSRYSLFLCSLHILTTCPKLTLRVREIGKVNI